jgi:hypothetical protein
VLKADKFQSVRQTGHSKASSAMAIAAAFFQRSYKKTDEESAGKINIISG